MPYELQFYKTIQDRYDKLKSYYLYNGPIPDFLLESIKFLNPWSYFFLTFQHDIYYTGNPTFPLHFWGQIGKSEFDITRKSNTRSIYHSFIEVIEIIMYNRSKSKLQLIRSKYSFSTGCRLIVWGVRLLVRLLLLHSLHILHVEA